MSLDPAPTSKDAYLKKQQFISRNRSSLQGYYNDEWISTLNTKALNLEIRTALQHAFPHLADCIDLKVTSSLKETTTKYFSSPSLLPRVSSSFSGWQTRSCHGIKRKVKTPLCYMFVRKPVSRFPEFTLLTLR